MNFKQIFLHQSELPSVGKILMIESWMLVSCSTVSDKFIIILVNLA